MIAAESWSPEQWLVLIGGSVAALGAQIAIIIKLVKGDKTTKATADTLAEKVTSNTATVAASHDVLAAKVDNILDEQKHHGARLDGTITVGQALSNRVDSHELQLDGHEQRLTATEAEIERLKVKPG